MLVRGVMVWGMVSAVLVGLLAATGEGPPVTYKPHEVVMLGAVGKLPAGATVGRSFANTEPTTTTR